MYNSREPGERPLTTKKAIFIQTNLSYKLKIVKPEHTCFFPVSAAIADATGARAIHFSIAAAGGVVRAIRVILLLLPTLVQNCTCNKGIPLFARRPDQFQIKIQNLYLYVLLNRTAPLLARRPNQYQIQIQYRTSTRRSSYSRICTTIAGNPQNAVRLFLSY